MGVCCGVFLEKTVQHNYLYLAIVFKVSEFPFVYLCPKDFFPESLLSTALVCVYINKENNYLYLFIKERKEDKVIVKDILYI